MTKLSKLVFLVAVLFSSTLAGQTVCPNCCNVDCSNPAIMLTPGTQASPMIARPADMAVVQVQAIEPVEVIEQASADRPSERAAVRVRTGGGCGSGSVCGLFRDGCLILTNAHVAGTRVGRTVTVDCVVDGQAKSLDATVIMAAYSDRTLTDWAVLYCEGLTEIEPVKLSIEKPTGRHYTRGSPRCVWPLQSTDVVTADIADGSPLWRWRPNSIGGQSGSGVWSYEDDLQDGLLTWSWGGLGAGQQTSEIYRQAREKSIGGEPRIDGLREVTAQADVIVEVGFFSEADIDELPIWKKPGDQDDDDQDDDDQDDDCDDGDELKLTDKEKELIAKLRSRSEALGIDHAKAIQLILGVDGGAVDETGILIDRLRDRARERGIDFIKLLELILQIIEIFQNR